MKFPLSEAMDMLNDVSEAAAQDIHENGLGTGNTNTYSENGYDRTDDDIMFMAENIVTVAADRAA